MKVHATQKKREPSRAAARSIAGTGGISLQGKAVQGKFVQQNVRQNVRQNMDYDDEEYMQGKFAQQNVRQNMRQKMEYGDDEEYMQGKFAQQNVRQNVVRQNMRQKMEYGDDEEYMQGKFAQQNVRQNVVRQNMRQKMEYGDDEEYMQGKFVQQNVRQNVVRQNVVRQNVAEPSQAAASSSGLPVSLQAGLEQLSGRDLSAVQVHYDSPKPAQLNAHAYAQGPDIHVGPGQEKHLAHEGWHTVQQMQGRVQPTTEVDGVQVNDDHALEREADVMGAKAENMFL